MSIYSEWEEMVNEIDSKARREHRDAFRDAASRQLDSLFPDSEGTTVGGAVETTKFYGKGVWEAWADTRISTLDERDIENGMDLDYAAVTGYMPEPVWEESPDRSWDHGLGHGARGVSARRNTYPVYPKPVPPELAVHEQVRRLTSQDDVRRSLYDMAGVLDRAHDRAIDRSRAGCAFFLARHRLQPSR